MLVRNFRPEKMSYSPEALARMRVSVSLSVTSLAIDTGLPRFDCAPSTDDGLLRLISVYTPLACRTGRTG